MDANKLIEEAEMLCSVASAAPWRCEHGRGRFEIKSGAVSLAGVLYEQDRDFIVGARMLVPALTAALKASEERARKADELAAANLAANKRIVELEHERDSARAELAQPYICPNCTAKLRRLDRMDSAGHAAHELDKARKDAAGQNKRAQKAEQEAKAVRAELARLTTPRPIADAPRDGTWVLGFWDETTRWDAGRYSRFLVVQWLHDEWLDEDGDELNAPSHYLPLPEVKP